MLAGVVETEPVLQGEVIDHPAYKYKKSTSITSLAHLSISSFSGFWLHHWMLALIENIIMHARVHSWLASPLFEWL